MSVVSITTESVVIHHDAVVETAQARLAASLYANVRRVSCSYDDDVLTLRGWLPSFYEKQIAQEAVRGLNGVRRIVNEIEVNGKFT